MATAVIDTLAAYFGVAAAIATATACLCMFLAGCSPCERLSRLCPPAESETLTVHDSIHVTDTVYIRDTLREVRLVPGEATAVVPAADTARVETLYATATAWLCGGAINLNITNKESALALVTETERLRALVRFYSQRAEKTEVKRETYVPVAVKWLAGTGAAALLGFLILAIWRLARLFR